MKSLKTYISILKHVKNRPTKYFWFLILIIVGLFLQAYMHNHNIVYLMMFFLVGVAGAASLYGVLNLYYIKVSLLSYERFFAKESASYTLLIQNDSKYTLYDIHITSNSETKHLISIQAYDKVRLSFSTKFLTRGLHYLESVEVSSLFPLPHELKYKSINIEKSIFVYAQPKGISLFNIYHKNNSINGEIDEFDGIKLFHQGESISYIHWPSLAKNSTLQSKSFLFESENEKLHFDLEKIKGDFESRLSQLTLWVLECEKNSLEFTLTLKERVINSKELSIDEILKTIAQL